MDKEKLIKDKDNKIVTSYWESNHLKQVTNYSYLNGNLIEEKIIQFNKEDNSKKIMCCSYYSNKIRTIIIEDNDIQVIDYEN